ncbi:MAG: DNA repair protein RecN [Mariprofundaceae bacterium]|nr:DNA repair protein RecN [Mariprofundaceae bacterium]
MLTEFRVRQFALIDEVSLQLSAGMTVFTGETGAGKSILVDALGAVFGARASSDWVRHGAEKTEISAVVESDDARLMALLAEQDIDIEEQLFLKRTITADGRSRAYVNGTPTPARILQQIGEICLDLHGQHEHQALLHPDFQRQIIDARLPKELSEKMVRAHEVLKQAEHALSSLKHDQNDTEQQEAWMRSELQRLQGLDIEEGIVDQLTEQVEAGRHASQIQQAAADSLALLDEGDSSARNLMAKASHAVEPVAEYHSSLGEASSLLAQMDALMSEVEPLLRDALDSSFDQAELQAVEERLMSLHEAMRRHGVDEAGLIELMQSWEEKLSHLDTAGWDEEKLRADCDAAEVAFRKCAEEISIERSREGKKLAKELRPFLDRLGLAGMKIQVEVSQQKDSGLESGGWNASGWDKLQFVASSNPGEPFRPLASIASGGELSRFVLALKGCGALVNAPQIAVFDEVDVGIGGETAWCVGELLAAMGQERQLLVVSHLPQVAACADHQVCIRKGQEGERTLTRLDRVAANKRQEEIARMLGGANEESLQHAQQMLKRGSEASPKEVAA